MRVMSGGVFSTEIRLVDYDLSATLDSGQAFRWEHSSAFASLRRAAPGSSEALATLSRPTGEGLGVRGGSWVGSTVREPPVGTMNRPEGRPSPGSSEALATLSRRTGEGPGVRGGSWVATCSERTCSRPVNLKSFDGAQGAPKASPAGFVSGRKKRKREKE